MRKPVLGVSDQVRHLPGCTATEDGWRLEYEPSHEKPTICIWENKDADQLRGNREADQRLCFRYIDSTIPLLSKSKISNL